MDPFPVRQQEEYLHDEEWHVEVDKMFIQVLVDQSKSGNFRLGQSNAYAIHIAMSIINSHFLTNFTFVECKRKLEKLQHRQNVFFWVVNFSGVRYNPKTNEIDVYRVIWVELEKKDPLALAYVTKGDPAWRDLCDIFGTEHLGDDNDDVIDISSDHGGDEDEEDGGDPIVLALENLDAPPPIVGPIIDVNAPPPANVVIDISSDSDGGTSGEFWKDLFEEGYASDTLSGGSMHSMSNSSGGFEGPSSNASNSPGKI
ncbi:hypothetical protein BUALT_Bualt19G0055100 [Buddleja alternifolia]|uniref:Myb/SANT-like domain-containing protein n=1 Tax=Buddleja alternifolia TaxID=168488 RepID=A0AAV6W7Q1_9LAMI|nr:hypothetical protein BUALT_Bualt19G0055100 [Buddleja alternifolia]